MYQHTVHSRVLGAAATTLLSTTMHPGQGLGKRIKGEAEGKGGLSVLSGQQPLPRLKSVFPSTAA